MKTKLLQVTLYADRDVYVRDSPKFEEILETLVEKLVNQKVSKFKMLFKYYNKTLKQIEYQYIEINRISTRL